MRGILLLAIGIAITAAYLFPLFWMYVTAFKGGTEIFAYPPTFLPHEPVWNVPRVFVDHTMARYLWNSLLIATGVTVLATVLGTGCAYVLARIQNVWISVTLFAILLLQVLPPSLMVTPIFVLFNQLGLLASPRLAVILAQTAKVIPLYVVLCRASFVQIPRELEDAAMVDGSSRVGAFFKVVLPLARNGILVTSVLVFLQSFGEYVYARSLIGNDQLQTATVGLQSFMGPTSNDWNGIMTYSAIYVTPILIVFVLLQRRIVSGLTAGALK